MKRILVALLVAVIMFNSVACTKIIEDSENVQATNQNSKEATDSSDDLTKVEANDEIEEKVEFEADNSVDIDLTAMSSTMVYSEVFNMMMSPDEYIGKTVKMEGICNMYQDPKTGQKYYACIVQDATKCCSQGLEFVLDENLYSQDDYPQVGDDVIIKGEFSTYKEGENQYLTMLSAQIIE